MFLCDQKGGPIDPLVAEKPLLRVSGAAFKGARTTTEHAPYDRCILKGHLTYPLVPFQPCTQVRMEHAHIALVTIAQNTVLALQGAGIPMEMLK